MAVSRLRVLACTAPIWVALGLSGEAFGQERCEVGQWRASAKLVSALSKCESRAAARGTETAAACVAKAEAKFTKALGKLETKRACVATNAAQLQEEIDATVAQLGALIDAGKASACCDLGALCHARPAGECAALGGTPGPQGSTCGGTGNCENPPVSGHCCLLSIGTCVGGPITSGRCVLVGGFLFENAVCSAGGSCEVLPR